MCERSPNPCTNGRPKVSCHLLHFVTLVSFCSKNLPFRSATTRRRQIRCQSSIKFDRLRPFLVFHSVFTIVFPFFGVFEFDQVRRSSIDFDQVCLSLFRDFELSCFRDPFSFSIRGKQNHHKDHESTKNAAPPAVRLVS